MLKAPGQLQTDHQFRGFRLAMNITAATEHVSEFKKEPGCATMFQRHHLSATIPIDLCGQPVGPASKLDQRKYCCRAICSSAWLLLDNGFNETFSSRC